MYSPINYAGIMLYAFGYLLSFKLCQHNRFEPTYIRSYCIMGKFDEGKFNIKPLSNFIKYKCLLLIVHDFRIFFTNMY